MTDRRELPSPSRRLWMEADSPTVLRTGVGAGRHLALAGGGSSSAPLPSTGVRACRKGWVPARNGFARPDMGWTGSGACGDDVGDGGPPARRCRRRSWTGSAGRHERSGAWPPPPGSSAPAAVSATPSRPDRRARGTPAHRRLTTPPAGRGPFATADGRSPPRRPARPRRGTRRPVDRSGARRSAHPSSRRARSGVRPARGRRAGGASPGRRSR